MSYNVKWKLNLDFSEYHPNYQQILIKLIDLTKTFAMVNNGGVYKSTSFVNKVENQKGTNIFKKKTFSEQLVSDQTLAELQELLNYNMVYGNGLGGVVKKRLSLNDSHKVYIGQSGPQIDWMVCANKKFTLGIATLTRSSLKSENHQNISLSFSNLNSPRKCMPILKVLLEKLKN